MEGMPCRPAKPIQFPVAGSVDITRIRPVVDHSLFQRLDDIKQLGEVGVVDRGAKHTRFMHSGIVGKWTQRRMRRWRNWTAGKGVTDFTKVTKQDALDTVLFAWLHDIGHGPLSHITDPLVSLDHEERAVAMLQEMRDVIVQAGGNPDRIIRMMQRKDPLCFAVLNTPFGVDKLAYLALDALYTGRAGMPDEHPFLDSVYYINREVVADVKIKSEVELLMQFYWRMYDEVYFRTAVLLTERYIQRMISMMLGKHGHDPEFTEHQLVMMKDRHLYNKLEFAKNPWVSEQFARYEARRQPYPALIFQPPPHHTHNWGGAHKVFYAPMERTVLENPRLRDPVFLYNTERQIEDAVDMPHQSVLLVPPVLARRFRPVDIKYRVNDGVRSIREMNPEWWDAQEKRSCQYARFFVGTHEEDCGELARPEVADVIRTIVQQALPA